MEDRHIIELFVNQLAEGALFELKTDPGLPARSVGMLLPKNKPVSYALHCFIDYSIFYANIHVSS